MKQINNTNLYVEVLPATASDIQLHDPCITYYNEPDTIKVDIPVGKYQHIGIVTQDTIAFDVEPYLEVEEIDGNDTYFKFPEKSYEKVSHALLLSSTDSDKVFRAMLEKAGFYWDNPLGKEPADNYPRGDAAVFEHDTVVQMKSHLREWRRLWAEQLTENEKLLIFKKLDI